MNLRRLECLLAVVDAGTVTAGAEALHMAQPALSRQLQLLERETGLQLFTRAHGRLSLTPAGRTFTEAARHLLDQTARTQATARFLRDGKVAELTGACTAATIEYLLAPFQATRRGEEPALRALPVDAGDPADRLADPHVDFAITSSGRRDGHVSLPLGTAPLRAHMSPDDPLVSERPATIPLRSLEGRSLLALPEPTGSRVALSVAMRALDEQLGPVHDINDGNMAMAMARSSESVAVVSDLPKYGVIAPIIVDDDGDPIGIPLRLAWLPDHFAAEAISQFGEAFAAFAARTQASRRGGQAASGETGGGVMDPSRVYNGSF